MTSDDLCPRCGGRFRCGMNDTAPCACTTLRLDAATLAALRQQWTGCLCLACLVELSQGAPMKKAGAVSDRPASQD